MNDVVVVEVHQHGDGLADDERDPHGSVAIDPVQVPAHKPRQGNLEEEEKEEEEEGSRGPEPFDLWHSEKEGELWLTWAIIPMKAHNLNILRGTLTKY